MKLPHIPEGGFESRPSAVQDLFPMEEAGWTAQMSSGRGLVGAPAGHICERSLCVQGVATGVM
jgi:hypothetical protein